MYLASQEEHPHAKTSLALESREHRFAELPGLKRLRSGDAFRDDTPQRLRRLGAHRFKRLLSLEPQKKGMGPGDRTMISPGEGNWWPPPPAPLPRERQGFLSLPRTSEDGEEAPDPAKSQLRASLS